MKRALAILSFAIAACGGGPMESPDNHGFGWRFDVQGASGMKLRYSPLLSRDNPPALPQWTDIAFYERAWGELAACAGFSAPAPPFVIVVPAGSLGAGVNGEYRGNPSLILIPEETVIRNTHWVPKHEMTHYGLHMSTGDLHANHDHLLFTPPETCISD